MKHGEKWELHLHQQKGLNNIEHKDLAINDWKFFISIHIIQLDLTSAANIVVLTSSSHQT